MSRQKITIVGAGPVGLCCAYFALQANYEVQIITLPFGAKQKCAGLSAGGMLAPGYEFFGRECREFTDFALESRYLWDRLAEKLGIEINPTSYAVADSEAQIERLEQINVEAMRRGLSCSKQKPIVANEGKNWLGLSCDGLIDPISSHKTILNYLTQNGAILTQAEVFEIHSELIITNIGKINCESIILAAGIGSKALAATMPELASLTPVRGQLVELNAPSPFYGAIRMGSAYILARGDKTIIGATMQRGDEDWRTRVTDNAALLNSPHELPPSLANAQISNAFCGVRPGSLDDKPIIGQSSLAGVFLACGAYRNGWLLAPKIGADLAHLIKTGENNFPKSFAPNRFASFC